MNTLSEYLAMGGYGAFVWPSYALAAIVLVGLVVLSLRDRSRNRRHLERLRLLRREGGPAVGEAAAMPDAVHDDAADSGMIQGRNQT